MTLDRAASGKLLAAKRELRARILRDRDATPAEDRATASASIAASLLMREDFASSKTVLLTLPFGSEWDTRALLAAALARAKTVALPRVNLATRMLDICAITRLEHDAVPGYRGIPEPCAHCALLDVATIDWVLVPGVAFDADGRRVGYGGGYYDRLLPLLRADAHRIAGAFELQLVERVPAASHDVAVEAIVTEARSISIAR
ncbi:MAG TPA: 5-formyltetrahydrofolate cyclo-ligase [Casimicrobiaceae bacterium]